MYNAAIISSVVLVIVIVVFIYYGIDDGVKHTSNYDNVEYIIRNADGPQIKDDSANYLAIINQSINFLVNYMRQNKIPDQLTADRLYNRWNSCTLRETSSYDSSVAFTVNKGREIRVTIRNNGKFENPNTVIFVILHELAHLMSLNFGHGEEFKQNFLIITSVASMLGIYKPVDYTLFPENYSGISINTTPCSHGVCDIA
jgi:hypothetical protein